MWHSLLVSLLIGHQQPAVVRPVDSIVVERLVRAVPHRVTKEKRQSVYTPDALTRFANRLDSAEFFFCIAT